MHNETSGQLRAVSHQEKQRSDSSDVRSLVPPSRRLLSLFAIYLHWYIGRHFHAFAPGKLHPLSHDGRPADYLCQPRLVVGSALACMVDFASLSPRLRRHYGPMDAAALKHTAFSASWAFPCRKWKPAWSGPISARRAADSLHPEFRSLVHSRGALYRYPHPARNLPPRTGGAGRPARRLHACAAGLRVHLLGRALAGDSGLLRSADRRSAEAACTAPRNGAIGWLLH